MWLMTMMSTYWQGSAKDKYCASALLSCHRFLSRFLSSVHPGSPSAGQTTSRFDLPDSADAISHHEMRLGWDCMLHEEQ